MAEIIQRTRPDVLLLNDFDYDVNGEAVDLFRTNYLEVGQNGAEAIEYPYVFRAPVNSGVASGFDLDRDGTVGGPDDAFGFGGFPGQHGMVVLSRYPILDDDVRTFQHLLWSSMPDARLPDDPATAEPGDWYTADELAVLPLASASMWDVPVDVDGTTVHVLAAQPTTPTAPSPEGVASPAAFRNADEIRFWADYIAGDDTSWIIDDAGLAGGLGVDAEFVIVGDLNADPVDGDSMDGAIQQLLDLDGVQDPAPTSQGGPEAAEYRPERMPPSRATPPSTPPTSPTTPHRATCAATMCCRRSASTSSTPACSGPPPTTPSPPSSPATHPPAPTTASCGRTSPPRRRLPTRSRPARPPGRRSTSADYGFDNFFDVPQLGHEAVRGTGCGGDGSIGDVIPDGYWRGYVRSWDGASVEQSSTLQFDLMCVYLSPPGDVNEGVYLDGWLVNTNDRTRTVPLAPGFFAHGTIFVGDEVYTPFDQPDVPFDPSRQVWLRILDGAAVWVVSAPDPT